VIMSFITQNGGACFILRHPRFSSGFPANALNRCNIAGVYQPLQGQSSMLEIEPARGQGLGYSILLDLPTRVKTASPGKSISAVPSRTGTDITV
jgi:hypothetical protein